MGRAWGVGSRQGGGGQRARAKGQRGKDMRRARALGVTTLHVRGWDRGEGRARGLRGRGLCRWVKGHRERAQP